MTTIEVAKELNRTRAWIVQLIHRGRLPATKIGRDYVIDPEDFRNFKLRKPTGRPRKNAQV